MSQITSKTKTKFQAPKGMKDILPEEQKYWRYILNKSQALIEGHGYVKIDTPILEETQLFNKGTGASTDIIEKELFSLTTKGGDKLSLRPEFTPNIMRAYFEHGMTSWPKPVKLWYFGPVFRYDRPQAGRLRQFNQIGFEIIGSQDPVLDAQVIQVSWKIFQKLNIKNLSIQINSIGCAECRSDYIKQLNDYYKNKTRQLCAECKKRLKKNPLRLLDCKKTACIRLTSEAPQSVDNLCAVCHDHFKIVLEYLEELDLPYELNYRLVRGLDYYTKTVFELVNKDDVVLSQSALGGGGRYDDLSKIISRKSAPGVGVSLGVERIILELQDQKVKIPELKKQNPKVFLAQLGDLSKKKALKLLNSLQDSNVAVIESFTRDSLKAQLRIADKLNVQIALILGQKEALEDTIIFRDMQSGAQEVVRLDKTLEELKKRLKK